MKSSRELILEMTQIEADHQTAINQVQRSYQRALTLYCERVLNLPITRDALGLTYEQWATDHDAAHFDPEGVYRG